ncbi:hypothetical protein ASG90_06775 [Nocardioides sp. Soil797]|nr:hypothetical protein ASG90_06775 [Nocardioides sp. Soil797]
MVSKRVRRVVAAACAVALTSLVGCSGDDKDSGDDPSADSTAAKPPEEPAAMSGSGAKAAKAFIEYYWAVATHAEATGDTTTLRELAGDACRPCDRQASRIERIHDDGGSISGGTSEVAGLQVLDQADGAAAYDVIVDLRTATRSVVESRGAEPVAEPARYETVDVTVSRDDDHWQVDMWRTPAPE